MATEQTSTHAAAAPAATIPTIDIPEDARVGRCGDLLFRLRTTEGTIDARAFPSHMYCRGTADALEAAGIIRKEWLPGAPGNNRTKQTVIFGVGGPTLPVGRARRTEAPEIWISVAGKKFEVMVPTTAEQKARLDAVSREWHRELERALMAAQEPAKQTAQVIDLAVWRARKQRTNAAKH